MRRSDWFRAIAGVVALAAVLAIMWVVSGGCALREFSRKPGHKPGCPNRSVWSDSAQKCIAREGR